MRYTLTHERPSYRRTPSTRVSLVADYFGERAHHRGTTGRDNVHPRRPRPRLISFPAVPSARQDGEKWSRGEAPREIAPHVSCRFLPPFSVAVNGLKCTKLLLYFLICRAASCDAKHEELLRARNARDERGDPVVETLVPH